MDKFVNPANEYRLREVLNMEKEMSKQGVEGVTRLTESQFMRNGLPILRVLIDDAQRPEDESQFDALAWSEFVGSWYVPLEIVSDDLTKVLWNIPALLKQGYSIKPVESMPTLSDQTATAGQHLAVHADMGNNMLYSTIIRSLNIADYVTYKENYDRAYDTITLLNKIFEHYGVVGRIPYPEGLSKEEVKTATEDKSTATREKVDTGFCDGEDI